MTGASGTMVTITGPALTVQGAVEAGTTANLTAALGAMAFNDSVTAATEIMLTAAGDITQTAAGRLTAPRFTASAGGGIALDRASNGLDLIKGMTAAEGSLLLRLGDNPAVVDGALAATQFLVVTAGGALTLNERPIATGGTVEISAGNGITLNSTELRGAEIRVAAGGGNLTATDVQANATGDLAFTIRGAGHTLRLDGGSYRGEHVVIAAGPAGDAASILGFSNTDFTVGTVLLLAAGGGIGEAGDLLSTIAGIATAARPLVIFETRRSPGALRDLDPAVFTAATRDNPALEPGVQPWQVNSERLTPRAGGRIFGTGLPGGDGSPAATRNAAGDVRLNLDAGQNPIFLLIDGGDATGQVVAGRIGVHGLPAGGRASGTPVVDLTGFVNGFGGTTAARFGLTTATPVSGQALYRINDCVISTLNCVATAIAQPLVLPLLNNFSLQGVLPSLDQDVLVPNIAEEDY
ncbi:hypothetical protein ACLF3G_26085 [Falsiroseomonas sp. HC035]|uniref:hypothetical protein n=1 Tax=Falsiroseomonas sp. HC035 TaxID=3390999 RepID=UPI003D31CD46